MKILFPLLCAFALFSLHVQAGNYNNNYGSESSDGSDGDYDSSSDSSDGDYDSSSDADYDFVPVAKLDASKLVRDQWYENIYADTIPEVLQACDTYVITSQKNGNLIMQYGYRAPGLDGDLVTRKLTLTQVGKTGRFKAYNNSLKRSGEVIILAHADNFDWVAFADTTGDADEQYISVISKTQRNLNGINKLLELSEKYGLDSQHLDLQTDSCDYKNILAQLKKQK